MAIHSHSAFLLSLILISLHSSSASVTVHEPQSLLDTICMETQNPEFCKTTLGSYPLIDVANIDELSMMLFVSAISQAKMNKYEAKYYKIEENIQEKKKQFETCMEDYEEILCEMKKAMKLYIKKEYRSIENLFNDAMKTTKNCEDGFRLPKGHSTPMTKDNQKMLWLDNIGLVILNKLTKN